MPKTIRTRLTKLATGGAAAAFAAVAAIGATGGTAHAAAQAPAVRATLVAHMAPAQPREGQCAPLWDGYYTNTALEGAWDNLAAQDLAAGYYIASVNAAYTANVFYLKAGVYLHQAADLHC